MHRPLAALLVLLLISYAIGQSSSQSLPVGYATLYAGVVSNPIDVVTDFQGSLYVVGNYISGVENSRVVKLPPSGLGPILVTYNQTSTPSTPIVIANGICLDSASNVYVVDSGNNRIVKFQQRRRPAAHHISQRHYPAADESPILRGRLARLHLHQQRR